MGENEQRKSQAHALSFAIRTVLVLVPVLMIARVGYLYSAGQKSDAVIVPIGAADVVLSNAASEPVGEQVPGGVPGGGSLSSSSGAGKQRVGDKVLQAAQLQSRAAEEVREEGC